MKSPSEKAIFKTLAYADIFDYPLKKDEIRRWLIKDRREAAGPVGLHPHPMSSVASLPAGTRWGSPAPATRRNLFNKSDLDKFGFKDGYYFLPGREKTVALRQKRENYSAQKLLLAQKIAKRLKIIPTIKMVAVTGALAWGNCEEDDDIDFLIVAQKKTLWLTRFLTTLLVELTGRRRRPGDKKPGQLKDKICLNMFLDEEHLALPLKERDFYTAHEVSQLKPLWDKDNAYQKFLVDNLWAREYLPNALSATNVNAKSHEEKVSGLSCFYSWIFVLERLARYLQLWYMRKRRTTEVISEGVIRFHPQDAREWVLREYKNRLQKYTYLTRVCNSR